MYKEIIIIIVVIALVVGLDLVSNNYTKAAVAELSSKLEDIRNEALEENRQAAESKMKDLEKTWEEKYNVLAFYIEHDELEKVETGLVKVNANIEVEEYEHVIEEIDATIFILEHIEQKQELDLRSIF